MEEGLCGRNSALDCITLIHNFPGNRGPIYCPLQSQGWGLSAGGGGSITAVYSQIDTQLLKGRSTPLAHLLKDEFMEWRITLSGQTPHRAPLTHKEGLGNAALRFLHNNWIFNPRTPPPPPFTPPLTSTLSSYPPHISPLEPPFVPINHREKDPSGHDGWPEKTIFYLTAF